MALDYTLKNLEVRQEIGDKTGVFNALNNLGLIYSEIKKYDIALRYSKEAYSIANQMKDKKKIAKSALNLGIIYYQLKDTAAAFDSYNKALENQTQLNDTIELSYIYYNLGELFYQSDHKNAITYFEKSLFLAEKVDNKEIISACLQVIADDKRESGNIEVAVSLGKKSLAIASEMGNLKVIDLAAQTLYKAYLQKRDFKNSLDYYIVAKNAQDSMLNEKSIAAMSDLRYSFELKQKMKQIELLEKTKEINEKNSQNQTLKFYLGTSVIVFLGLISFLIHRHYRIRQQKKERAGYEQRLISAKEKAEESDRLKSAFLANMSHEIRTPMNAIIGFSECLARPDLSVDKRERYSRIVKERSYDLLRIVEDVLDISRIEVGQLKIIETEVSLQKLLNDLFLEYNQKISENATKSTVQLKLCIPDQLGKLKFISDSQRLRQIITNLLDNAIKFTHAGFIEFGVTPEDNSKLVFYVKDTGIGIPDNKKDVIFDRFRQADEILTARTYGGSGLGLAIVKGIVNLMNGNIWLESWEGQGSTFYFSMPVKGKTHSRNSEG